MTDSSILKDITTYKSRLLSAFINSKEICGLLTGNPSYTEEDAENLIYSQVFPYLYTDETQTDTKLYLCFEVDVPRVSSHTIKDMKIIIWAYCQKDGMRIDENSQGTKVDILSDFIEKELRNSDKYGIGKLELQSATYFFPIKKYYGRQIIFSFPDFKIKGC